ncbi:MAG: TRAP transporter small permease [Clostridia bacterium]|nr:TRAP transporter small permease [Clostridia bacterium]
MKKLSGFVQSAGNMLDKAAGICTAGVMLLIVSNIILRTVFHRPILGTYEIVGFLASMGVGLALAQCSLQDGHIAVSFVTDRLPKRLRSWLDLLMNTASFFFWGAAAWYVGQYAWNMKIKGLVSASAEIPVYPFILMAAFSLFTLSLTLLYKSVAAGRQAVGELPEAALSWKLDFNVAEKETT